MISNAATHSAAGIDRVSLGWTLMRFAIASFSLAFTVFCCALLAQDHQRSVWDGVYTEKQAQRGDALYGTKCQSCHGEDLEGDIVEHPQLAGGDFRWKWNGLTLAPLFERIHRDMPIDNAGKLSRDQSADLLAYLLKANHFPAGQRDLPSDPGALEQIRFDATRPDRKP